MNHPPSRLIQVLNGQRVDPVPVWMMRQAGRHLPEYRALREKAGDFLNFCYSPVLAAQATLQPIERYDMDAAIVFSDILLILDALGLRVRFEKTVGPVIEPLQTLTDLKTAGHIDTVMARLSPVCETIERARTQLSPEKALIGFCGSPWTVALYAIEGRGGTDKAKARMWVYKKAGLLHQFLDILADISAHYLAAQARAGADVLMLFESWAEGLPDDVFERLVVRPNMRLVKHLRALGITTPIIGFPRGAATALPQYTDKVPVNAIGLDTAVSPHYARSIVPDNIAIQGHLDPLLLVAGGKIMVQRVDELLAVYHNRLHIFNLGHGVRPETPIKNVKAVIDRIRGVKDRDF